MKLKQLKRVHEYKCRLKNKEVTLYLTITGTLFLIHE